MMISSLAPSRQLVSARNEQDGDVRPWTIPVLAAVLHVRYLYARLICACPTSWAWLELTQQARTYTEGVEGRDEQSIVGLQKVRTQIYTRPQTTPSTSARYQFHTHTCRPYINLAPAE